MSGDYIKLNRKMLKWEWYRNHHTKNVFLHCLLKANWKDARFEGKIIKRGSFVTSIKKMSLELDLTEDEVRTAIKHLLATGEITKQTTNRNTIITVSNYDLYQDVTEQIPNKSQTNPKQIPNKSQPIPNPFPTIEEYKEGEELEEREEGEEGKNNNITVSDETVCQTDVRRAVDAWNKLSAYGIKPVSRLRTGTKRHSGIVARIRQYGIDDVLSAIENIKSSDFLQGKNNRGWTITFDWFVLPNNFPKVLDGNYSSKPYKKPAYENRTAQMLEDSYGMMADWVSEKEGDGE